MEYSKKLNFLVIMTILLIIFLINVFLLKETFWFLVWLLIFCIVVLFLWIKNDQINKSSKIKYDLINPVLRGFGIMLGICLSLIALLSIIGLSKDIFYKGQFNFIYYLILAIIVLILGLVLLYFSYMSRKEKRGIKKIEVDK